MQALSQDQLAAFAAVVRTGSFTRAARELHVTQPARVTAHALARHLGLYRNREPDPATALDPLVDSPTSEDNLMYWGENGGTALSFEQREILRQSPVLR